MTWRGLICLVVAALLCGVTAASASARPAHHRKHHHHHAQRAHQGTQANGSQGANSTAQAAATQCGNVYGESQMTGARMENIRAGGTSCASARQLAADYMRYVDANWNEQDYGCAPDSSNSPATCNVDGYQCVATASSQSGADDLSCRRQDVTVTWHANWHPAG